ncbi:hypothetical protein [Nocardia implantans]|uniref:Uncharacterized protein n=1 Tax=Nocardia implantans TaxID=3108168 RepID=A0ABU6B5E4_9NOCA|nr:MULTISPECIES: hypothetical protein [unclassified Nocardia]MBF6195569.1 hypothetical protein [Nocardia beijingensis]MEA3533028.1 hypothetical protein [Nocardia sp. CDC192]MEB3514850.1 hypothetical protein [Nocardia sp. CDC186]
MNPLLLIGGAVLAVGMVGLIISVLLRPAGSKARVTVADLQARLEREQSAMPPETEGPVDDEPRSDEPRSADAESADAESADAGLEEREQSPAADEPRDATADPAHGEAADQVLLPDHLRHDK